jgi:DNA-binding Lrp family transcriptional regulator
MPENQDLVEFLLQLSENGIQFNPMDLKIMELTQERHKTYNELAKELGVTYKTVWYGVKKLRTFGLLSEKRFGQELKFKCNIDVSNLVDPTIRVNYKNQRLDFEDLFWLLEYKIATNFTNSIQEGIAHILLRAIEVTNDEKLTPPTAWEVKLTLDSWAQELAEIASLAKQIANLPIYSDSKSVKSMLVREALRYDDSKQQIEMAASRFRNNSKDGEYKARKKQINNIKQKIRQDLKSKD